MFQLLLGQSFLSKKAPLNVSGVIVISLNTYKNKSINILAIVTQCRDLMRAGASMERESLARDTSWDKLLILK